LLAAVGSKAPPAPKVRKEIRGRKAIEATQAPAEHKAWQVRRVVLGHRGLLDCKEPLEPQVPPEQAEAFVTPFMAQPAAAQASRQPSRER